MILGEIAAARVLQIEDADYSFLVDQRNRQFRARLRIYRDVAVILGNVRHEDRFLCLRGVPHHPAAHRDVVLQVQSFLEALRETVLQFFSRFIQQKDAEHLVFDQAVEQLGDAPEAWRVVRVCNRAFSMPTAMRDAISVSRRLCSSVK